MKKPKLSLIPLCLSLSLAWSLLPGPAQAQTTTVQSAPLKGVIRDGRTGAPLSDVYIRQQDALASGLSDGEGRFQLQLNPQQPPVLVFSKNGYESVSLRFEQLSAELSINLMPLVNYTPSVPPAHSETVSVPESIFTNQLGIFYQGSFTALGSGTSNVSGWSINEFGIDADVALFAPLHFRGRLYRGRQPVNVANFPFQPAFFQNTLQARVGAGKTWEIRPGLEAYLGGDLMLTNRSPDNRSSQDRRPVPYTGTIMDYEQNRLGVGASGVLAWKVNDWLALYPEVTVYPLTYNFVRDNGPGGFMLAGDAGVKARAQIMPGAYAVANLSQQLWWGGSYLDSSTFLWLGISLDPWTLAAKL